MVALVLLKENIGITLQSKQLTVFKSKSWSQQSDSRRFYERTCFSSSRVNGGLPKEKFGQHHRIIRVKGAS